MIPRIGRVAALIVAVVALAGEARAQSDAGLAKGIGQVQDGYFEDAATTLNGVIRRLSPEAGRKDDLAQAYLWVGIAHAQLDSEKSARAAFREAFRLEPRVSLAEGWPPKVTRPFAAAKAEAIPAAAGATAPAASASTATAAGAPPAQITIEFESRSFALTLPPRFELVEELSPFPGYKTLGFMIPVNQPNRSTAIMQISLLDMVKGDGRRLTLGEFTAVMVETMSKNKTDWASSVSDTTLSDMPAKRVDWSGTQQASPEEIFKSRGFMILAVKDDVGYRLEAQDLEAGAAQSLPVTERALRTFTRVVK